MHRSVTPPPALLWYYYDRLTGRTNSKTDVKTDMKEVILPIILMKGIPHVDDAENHFEFVIEFVLIFFFNYLVLKIDVLTFIFVLV